MTHPLAHFRQSAGLSRERFAKDVGTTRQTIHRIEEGEQTPSLELVRRIIAATGDSLSANDFLPPAPKPLAAPAKTEAAA